MEKFWKIIAITAIMVIVLAIGASFAVAQTDDPTTPPEIDDSLPGDLDGDGLCDSCGLAPQGGFGRGGMHGQGDFGPGARGSFGPMHGGRFDGEHSALDLLSEELDMTIEEVVAELQTGISVAELAENHGVDIDVIIDALVEQARERITERLNTPWGENFGTRSHPMLDDLAEALGLTADEVIAELETGISLAELAENHGVDVQEVIDAWMGDMQARMNDAVEAGRLTQEQADEMLTRMAEQITERVNEPWEGGQHFGPMGGPGFGRGGHHGGMRGGMHGGFNNWNQPAPETDGTNF